MSESPAEVLAALPPEERAARLAALPPEAVEALLVSWRFLSRPEQRAPEWLWRWWVMVTGRGFGKNRSGSEWVVERCEQFAAHDHPHQVALMNSTFGLVRALQIEGESGIAAVAERKGYRLHHPSTSPDARLVIPRPDGTTHTSHIEIHTADIPDRVRGRNVHTVHADELASWRHKTDPEGGTAFTNIDLALRSLCPPGMQPQGLVTTTPRPVKLVKALLAGEYGATAVTRGSLFDNAANLAPGFIDAILRRYAGTRLGAQEVEGMVLDDIEGALWTYAMVHAARVDAVDPDDWTRPVVGVDPSGGEEGGAECGIVVVARDSEARLAMPDRDRLAPHGYVLEDATVQGETADGWARAAVAAYHRWGASALAVETNYGGDMVRAVIAAVDPAVRIVKVKASQGKLVRAQPVSALYEQGRVHHVGEFVELEEQMTSYTGDPKQKSPDRMDALVWAFTHALPPGAPAKATSPAGSGAGWRPGGGRGPAVGAMSRRVR